jgi:hypothetical protein
MIHPVFYNQSCKTGYQQQYSEACDDNRDTALHRADKKNDRKSYSHYRKHIHPERPVKKPHDRTQQRRAKKKEQTFDYYETADYENRDSHITSAPESESRLTG